MHYLLNYLYATTLTSKVAHNKIWPAVLLEKLQDECAKETEWQTVILQDLGGLYFINKNKSFSVSPGDMRKS